jgi:S1-C subfamily serine protease
VNGASSVRVSFPDGTSVKGTVTGKDAATDVAVVKVDLPASQLHPLTLGSTKDVQVGDGIIAIGNPFGYAGTVTAGIVSAKGRSIQAPNGFTITNALQTDAAINHGNSGGPLLDSRGRVVAIADQIADSGVNGNVGVGFAVPIDTAKAELSQLIAGTKVSHGWLGISGTTIEGALVGQTGVAASKGVLVTGVTAAGPAAKAGLHGGATATDVAGSPVCVGGDVITAVNGAPLASVSDLQTQVLSRKAGDVVHLSVTHADGTTGTVDVTLEAQPSSATSQRVSSRCAAH